MLSKRLIGALGCRPQVPVPPMPKAELTNPYFQGNSHRVGSASTVLRNRVEVHTSVVSRLGSPGPELGSGCPKSSTGSASGPSYRFRGNADQIARTAAC